MPLGAGKYDDLATLVREKAEARGVVVIVFDGNKGQGFSIQGDLRVALALSGVLRAVADDIDRDLLTPRGAA